MKRLLLALLSSVMAVSAMAAKPTSTDPTLQKMIDRYLGWKDVCSQLVLRNVSKSGSTQEGGARLCVLVQDDGSRYGRVTVTSPAAVRGMDLITKAELVQVKSQGKSQQWLYMPASKRATLVNANNTETPFLGSEFTYADLDLGYIDPARLTYLDEQACGSDKCRRYTVLGLKPGSVTRIVSVVKDSGAIRHVDVQKQGKPYKILDVQHETRDPAGWWVGDKLIMRNLQTGGRTESTWSDTHYNSGMTPDKFDPKKLYGAGASGRPQ